MNIRESIHSLDLTNLNIAEAGWLIKHMTAAQIAEAIDDMHPLRYMVDLELELLDEAKRGE